ncbi:hypothetical protein HK099_006195 [Clydaea vesicula]|uniref:Uncharacterized protein n=1 Tax=Clydaea vesicula TaxID=447962 RepID=A0AAD5U9S4_9FUNG|nr:hypothetical protein HK099_006195 [Clydaea vesicula]KAJ3395967.1 hypothetical protein HDU92_004464 [Lobulomyces angularis]
MTAVSAVSSFQPTTPTTPAVDPFEVGWLFVQEYYTFLNREPHRLHCFYNKKSLFIHGQEAEPAQQYNGQTEIHEHIQSLGFEDCKVLVSQVDSQASQNGGIIIQVLGEMSNMGGSSHKFAQTFFLAEQPSGYYVLNDIFRYLKEDIDNEYEESADPTHDTSNDAASNHRVNNSGVTDSNIDFHQQQQQPPLGLNQQLEQHNQQHAFTNGSLNESNSLAETANKQPNNLSQIKRSTSKPRSKSPVKTRTPKSPEPKEVPAEVPAVPTEENVPQNVVHQKLASTPQQPKSKPPVSASNKKQQQPKIEQRAADQPTAAINPAPASEPVKHSWAALASKPAQQQPVKSVQKPSQVEEPKEDVKVEGQKENFHAQGGRNQRNRQGEDGQQRVGDDKDKHSLYIKHLPEGTQEKHLRETFEKVGAVKNVELQGKSVACIEFVNLDPVAKCIGQQFICNGGTIVPEERRRQYGFNNNRNNRNNFGQGQRGGFKQGGQGYNNSNQNRGGFQKHGSNQNKSNNPQSGGANKQH